MVEINKCIICNSDKLSLNLICKDYYYSQDFFNIFICDSCGFKFTNPIPDEKDIGNYYNSDEYLSHTKNKKGLFNYLYFQIRNYTIKKKYKIIKKYSNRNRILDIGCGTGELLSYLKSKDFIVTGLEPNIKARDFAINNHNLDIYSNDYITNFKDSSFDTITLWHVLEHIYNVNYFLSEVKRILSENGTLIIAVPINNSYDSEHYGKCWAAYDVPRHIYHFNQDTINRLLAKFGFKLIRKIPMLFDSFYVSLLSEKYKTAHPQPSLKLRSACPAPSQRGGEGKLNYFKGFFIGLYSNIRAFFNKKDYSSLVFVYRKFTTNYQPEADQPLAGTN